MNKPFVIVSSAKAEAMFDRLGRNADNVEAAVQLGGQKMLNSISGIPVDTGELEASPYLEVRGTKALILSDTPYALPVFMGHKDRAGNWVEPQPPRVGYTADEFARDVAQQVFGV